MSKRKPITASEIRSCPLCQKRVTPALMGAAASVGISKNKSTEAMLLMYLMEYHRHDHEEPWHG